MLRTERRYTKQTRDAIRRQNRELPPEPADYVRAFTTLAAVVIVLGLLAIVFWKVALVIVALVAFAIIVGKTLKGNGNAY